MNLFETLHTCYGHTENVHVCVCVFFFWGGGGGGGGGGGRINFKKDYSLSN